MASGIRLDRLASIGLGVMDQYDKMTNEELARHINMRGVPSGPREVFPGRQIIQWLRERDRDEARWAGEGEW